MEPGAKFSEGVVEAFGYAIRYAEAGAGDVVISLPGSAGLEMSTAKDILADSFRVIEINPPGWGGDSSLTGTMRQSDLAHVIASAIAELGIERYHLTGTSMGGATAFWLASHYPDRVQSLLLEAPMLFVRKEDLVRPEGLPPSRLIREGVVQWDDSYPAPPPHPRKPWATAQFFHEQMRRRFKMFAYIEPNTEPGSEQPLEEFAKTLNIPTTLLLGTQDEILKPCYADHFRFMVPGATITLVDDATHDIQNTAPGAFVDAVLAIVL